MKKRLGVLPMQVIQQMTGDGLIIGSNKDNIQIASLDLSVSEEIYRIEGIFQPRPGESIHEVLREISKSKHNICYPLEKGVMYIVKLKESLNLPDQVYGYCNPKSSTGRNDVHVRVMADGVPRFDAATPAGFEGGLWLVVSPKSFPVRIVEGLPLSQIRFFNYDTRFDELELQLKFEHDKLLWSSSRAYDYQDIKIKDSDGSIVLTINLEGDIVGWECIGPSRVFDMSKIDYFNPEMFFRPLRAKNGTLLLKQNVFYILETRERLRVPPYLSSEMVPVDARAGEFRVHYAGYIDPGWGWGDNGDGCGRRLTLEVRPFEDILFRDRQPVAKVRFEFMAEIPEVNYDSSDKSSYIKEYDVPRLSKHFRQ